MARPTGKQTVSCTKPRHPGLQSHSFSRSYGTNLPTSLTYIILSTRGYSPRRPAADMGTSWCDSRVNFSLIFKVPPDAHGHSENCCALGKPKPILFSKKFQGLGCLCRKDNSSQSSGGRLKLYSCYHVESKLSTITLPGTGIRTCFPFGCRCGSKKRSKITAPLNNVSTKP